MGVAGPTEPRIEIGIEATDRKAVAESLSRLLADSYTPYLKTHNFYWNVTGPMFSTLHLMSGGRRMRCLSRGKQPCC